ncbi:uncharacterized protein TM35_000013570 [Trypanosoma theileri]|uniref:Uncharacterized protein n=1 Tax=Trypanosoma theileri TaxID=67003 RepID=A0A1X0PAK0_9TRYP|nr:uncharacterized protein TM35_000013570 [Trypanosoma theileri]ORC93480.1 hypothetical protein TM35_000013570 [Trypanosoma theileri]
MPGKRLVKNGARGSQQSYMNKVKFDPYRYKLDDQKIPAAVISTMTSLCCRRCCDILQWKVDYGKYIPLERYRKCNCCHEKTVALSYHHICQKCAMETGRCAKCQKPPIVGVTTTDADNGKENEHEVNGLRKRKEESDDDDDDDDDDDECYNYDVDGEEYVAKDDAPSKYAFVDQEDSDEEFKPLRGLDIRQVKNKKVAAQRQQESDRVARLRERERRTVLRRAAQESMGDAEPEDSDEEI